MSTSASAGSSSAELPSVVEGMKIAATFHPPWLLSHADVQTVAGAFAKRDFNLPHRRERLETPDGDFFDVDFMGGLKEGPTVLIIHGLGGSSGSKYVTCLASHLLDRGIRPVALNLRGSSGEPNRAQRLYHAAAYEDVLVALTYLEKTVGAGKLGVVGFSLGGSITLNLLGRAQSQLPANLVCGAAVSPPLDLLKGADALESGAGRKWTSYLLGGLRNILQPRLDSFDAPGVDAQRAFAASTIREFDSHLIAPLHGFKDVHQYYTEASSIPHLPRINIPTLIVRARDDPFLAPTDVDLVELRKNPMITPVLTEKGGHIGYVVRDGFFGLKAWSEEVTAEWLKKKFDEDAAAGVKSGTSGSE